MGVGAAASGVGPGPRRRPETGSLSQSVLTSPQVMLAFSLPLFPHLLLPRAQGLRYTDLRIGGGQRPTKGFLMVVDYV